MRYRLHTLLIVLALAPPLLWGGYVEWGRYVAWRARQAAIPKSAPVAKIDWKKLEKMRKQLEAVKEWEDTTRLRLRRSEDGGWEAVPQSTPINENQ